MMQIGMLFTIALLISTQLFYANAVPSYWNILFVVYWFNYQQAVDALCEDIVECEESQLIDTHEYLGWILDDTQCKVTHKDYLIAFDGSPISAFWFDSYTGDYGEIDIVKEFPFLAEKLAQKT